MKLPKPRIKIGDWVRIRKTGIEGMYQIISYNEDGTLVVEQRDGSYVHKMKITQEDIIR